MADQDEDHAHSAGIVRRIEGGKLFGKGVDEPRRAKMLEKAHSRIILCLGEEAIGLLNSVLRSYEHLRVAVLYEEEATITHDGVECALRSKKMQKASGDQQETAEECLNVEQQPKRKFMEFGADVNFQERYKEEYEREETRSCHYCKRPGHLKRDCCAWRQKQAQREWARNSADTAEDVDATEMFNIVGQSIEDQWILDSGCSFHMCPHKEWFIDIRFMDKGSVMLGNDQTCPVMEIGNIKLKMHYGGVRIFKMSGTFLSLRGI